MVVPSTSEKTGEIIVIVVQGVTQQIGKIDLHFTVLTVDQVDDQALDLLDEAALPVVDECESECFQVLRDQALFFGGKLPVEIDLAQGDLDRIESKPLQLGSHHEHATVTDHVLYMELHVGMIQKSQFGNCRAESGNDRRATRMTGSR